MPPDADDIIDMVGIECFARPGDTAAQLALREFECHEAAPFGRSDCPGVHPGNDGRLRCVECGRRLTLDRLDICRVCHRAVCHTWRCLISHFDRCMRPALDAPGAGPDSHEGDLSSVGWMVSGCKACETLVRTNKEIAGEPTAPGAVSK